MDIEAMRWKLMAVKRLGDWQDEVTNMSPSDVRMKFNYYQSVGRIYKEKKR